MMNLKYLDPFESGHRLALIVTVLLAIGMAIDLIATVSGLSQAALISSVAAGRAITDDEAMANDARQMLIGIIQLMMFVATAICFLIWIHRAHKNLPALGVAHLEYSPVWAVGGFFVPFLNLVRPFQVVREIWKASDPDVDFSIPHSWQYAASTPVIGFWWAAWLIGSIVGQIAFRLSLRQNTSIDDMMAITYLTIASDLIGIIAGAFAIVIVRGIDERQERKFRRLIELYTPPQPPPPPPNNIAWSQKA